MCLVPRARSHKPCVSPPELAYPGGAHKRLLPRMATGGVGCVFLGPAAVRRGQTGLWSGLASVQPIHPPRTLSLAKVDLMRTMTAAPHNQCRCGLRFSANNLRSLAIQATRLPQGCVADAAAAVLRWRGCPHPAPGQDKFCLQALTLAEQAVLEPECDSPCSYMPAIATIYGRRCTAMAGN